MPTHCYECDTELDGIYCLACNPEMRGECVAPGETSEVPTKRRRGDRIVRNGQVLEFIEEELEGEKWTVIGPAP